MRILTHSLRHLYERVNLIIHAVQWVKRFASSRSGWVSFMSFWFDLCLSDTPRDVFAVPFSFRLGDLPPFYKSVVVAWRELGGAFCTSRSSLVFGSADPCFFHDY